jgi:hypothetical protein
MGFDRVVGGRIDIGSFEDASGSLAAFASAPQQPRIASSGDAGLLSPPSAIDKIMDDLGRLRSTLNFDAPQFEMPSSGISRGEIMGIELMSESSPSEMDDDAASVRDVAILDASDSLAIVL